MEQETVKRKVKFQRVSKKDGKVILNNLIKNFKDEMMFNAIIYDEDYAGGTKSYINQDIVHQLIEKLCR